VTAVGVTVLDPPWKQDYAEVVMWCEYKATVECVQDSDQCTNSAGANFTAEMHPMLGCICNKCPGGKLAFAKALDDHDDDGGDSQDGADSGDSGIDTTDDPAAGRRAMDALNFTLATQCAKYSLAKCMEDYPTECSALGYQYSDDDLDELESTCTGEYAPGGGDGDGHGLGLSLRHQCVRILNSPGGRGPPLAFGIYKIRMPHRLGTLGKRVEAFVILLQG